MQSIELYRNSARNGTSLMKTERVLWKFHSFKVFHGGRAFSRFFCVLPIISAVCLEMAKRSRIRTVLNGHKTIGLRKVWDIEQSD